MSKVPISYEVYPPREGADASGLQKSILRLAETDPEFISVTFGAGGSSTKNSLEVLSYIKQHTSATPLAHITCVGNTFSEAKDLVHEFLRNGIYDFLALRGDLPQDPVKAAKGELKTAAEMVQLINTVQGSIPKHPPVNISVAAFPNGHPESDSLAQDVQALLSKQQAGAKFAITQLFFYASEYTHFVTLAREAGVTIPILPGIMPVTSMRRLKRVLELTGESDPVELSKELATDSKEHAKEAGIRWAAQLANELLDAGAPGIHLYAFNQHETVLQVLNQAGLR